jgi:hypothetical protein
MSLIPISRETMKNLRKKTEEENRIYHIKQTIQIIYNGATSSAKCGETTVYKYQIPRVQNNNFYSKNMTDILNGLQELFPDSSITHTIFALGTDGKMYDIEKLDDSTLPLVNIASDQSTIVIDWT